MPNPYANLTPSKKIKDDFQNITIGFDRVKDDMDAVNLLIANHLSSMIAHAAKSISIDPITGLTVDNVQQALAQLTAQLTSIIAGPAPSAAEIQDARTGADQIARASLGILMREIHAQQLKAAPTSVTLSPGLQNIIANRRSRLRIKDIKGRTLVNLLGRDGNFETDVNGDGVADGWSFSSQGSVASLDTVNFKYGSKGQKITSTASDTNTSRRIEKNNVNVEAGKYYIALVDVNTDGTSAAQLSLNNNTSTGVSAQSATSATNKLHYVKINPTGSGTIFFRCYNVVPVGTVGWLTFDGARLYEISAADYTAIDSMTAAQVAAKWPYVDDAKHTNAVYIQNAGKNLLPPFTDSAWTLHANAVVTGTYSLTLNATATFQNSYVAIPVIEGQTYFFGATHNGQLYLHKGVGVGGTAINAGAFTVDASYGGYVTARLTNTTTGTFTFSNPQLELGSTATTFEPKRGSYLYLPDCQLRSNVDGSVADSLYTDGEGKPRVTRRWRELDGALTWAYDGTQTGLKSVRTSAISGATFSTASNPDGSAGINAVAIKFDGKRLANRSAAVSTIGADSIRQNSGDTFLYLTISSADSGWGDAYTPTADEIKAFFSGYRMYLSGSSNATSVYNGTGTKAWVERYQLDAGNAGAGTTNWANVKAVVDAGNNAFSGTTSTPYRLIYQLASSVDEAINYEGSELFLHEGGNQIEVGTGVIKRESVAFDSSTKRTALSKRSARIFGVYKTTATGAATESITTYTSGSETLPQLVNAVDTSAAYAVTYLALDTYALGIAPQTINADYAPNIKESLDDVTRVVTDLKRDISVLQAGKAAKQLPQWIAATLLNGHTTYSPVEYVKDDAGWVTIRGSTQNGASNIVFYLPRGYRPKNNMEFTISVFNGTSYVYGEASIVAADGAVYLNVPSYTRVSLEGIRFQAV